MGKVELTTREYDDLRDTLKIYKEIVEAFATPEMGDWELGNIKSGASDLTYVSSVPRLSKEAKNLFFALIETNLIDFMKENDLSNSHDYSINVGISYDIGRIVKRDPPEVGQLTKSKEG